MANTNWRDEINPIIETLQNRNQSQTEVDRVYGDFCVTMFSEMDKYLNYRDFTGQNIGKRLKISKPYWNDDLSRLWKDMSMKEKLFLKTRENRRSINIKRLEFKEARTKFDKQLRYYQRQYRKQKIDELDKICIDDTRKFWEHIKRLGPKRVSSLPEMVKTEDGISSDPDVVINKWQNTFEGLYNPQNINYDKTFYDAALADIARYENDPILSIGDNDVINGDISYDETVAIIRKLKRKKAVGVDFIPNEVIKCPGINFVFYKLFSVIFQTGNVPSTWLKAIVKPIPKGSGKDPLVPINYRGISLLSCVAKTYTSLLNQRIVKYCDGNNIIVDEHNGFRKGRSCSDHLFTITSIIRNRLSQKHDTFCAFIDMEKAFDFLDRNLLLYRLLLYKIDGKMYRSIKALYQNTLSCVKLNNMFSGWFLTNSGVRQGDSLSPTLFALFINGLAEEIKRLNKGIMIDGKNVSILLYADDIVLLSENENDLQQMLDTMNTWCFKWKMKLNIDKSKIVHFRPKRKLKTDFIFNFGESEINIVNQYKYLGIILDENLTFENCARILSESAGRALGGIIQKFKILGDTGFNTFEKMYNTGVITVNNYAAEIWGYKDFSVSKNSQNRAMRYYLGVHKFAPIAGMVGDFGWMSPRFTRYKCILNYWNRLLSMDDMRLTKHVFKYDYKNSNVNKNWCSDVNEISKLLNMDHVFNNRLMFGNIYDTLYELSKDEWLENIHNKPKLRTYIRFKTNLALEPYVEYHMQKRQRSLLAQYRLGILPLRIETGRYDNTPVENRTCQLCDLGATEDEYHFVMTCPLFAEYRNILFENAGRLIVNFNNVGLDEQFTNIMHKCQKYLAKYIELAYEKRRGKLFTVHISS